MFLGCPKTEKEGGALIDLRFDPNPDTMVSGLIETSPVASKVSSMSEGVRTARVTAAHQVCLGLGVHNSRAEGWALSPEKSVRANFEPSVRQSRFSAS